MSEAATVQANIIRKLSPYAEFLLAKGSHHLPMMNWV